MNIRFLYLLLFIILLSLSCASTAAKIEQPESDQCLLIGAVILDINGYQDVNNSIFENIEVAIIGEILNESGLQRVSYWLETDENGYFYKENVPPGKYALKGIKIHSIDLGDVTIANELIQPQRNYFELVPENRIPMTGEIFDLQSNQRVINFQYNLFTLHRNGIVDFHRLKRLKNYKLSAGDVIDLPPVPAYFLEKFPTTGWTSLLKLQLN